MKMINDLSATGKLALLVALPMFGMAGFVLLASQPVALRMGICISAFLLAGYLAWLMSRQISEAVNGALSFANILANGDLERDVASPENPIAENLLSALGEVQAQLRAQSEIKNDGTFENALIQNSLDSMERPVMIADAEYNIVFINRSAQNLFNAKVDDIRKELPKFDPSQLLGANIDQFHKNPAHQRSMLASLQKTHVIDVRFGGLLLRITANPVFSKDGDRQGAVVEWVDRTQEAALEDEIQNVVSNALMGDLSNRIATNGDGSDFISLLSNSVNQLLEMSDRVIQDTIRVFSAIARGDLTQTIDAEYQGSFEKLKEDANATINKLTEVVGEIKISASSVKSAADQISQGNMNLSDRTEQQASSLEETAASMEEMTTTVSQNAENASQADQLAQEARGQAQQGGSVVGDAVTAMAAINDSSSKIADIIGVIDEIAFQTNLLALNASVEAARAGEQGRGFAVVASEVRNLAGRSATAAKEIKELIEDSGLKVEDGSRLVNQSGEVLDDIVAGVKKVTDIVSEISAASQEQSTGIAEVNRAITQMDEFTQQNAALVEQAAAASESLGEQANSLNEMMRFFTVAGGSAVNTSLTASATAPDGVERRASDRPWADSNRPQAETQSQTPAPAAAVANGDDGQWEDF